jgi:hypothetical protein
MAGSDVRTKRITGTGSLAVGPARIRQIQLKTASGTPRLTVTDGSGGATVLDLDFNASDTHFVSRRKSKMPPRNKKNFRPTKAGAGMTEAGVKAYRRANPGSKLKTAVTGKVKKGSKDAKRRKSFCARSAGQMKKFPKAAANPNSRLRQARRRWKC